MTAMAAVTVELASELLGEGMIPYEAQEPINFLHYRVGCRLGVPLEYNVSGSRRWRHVPNAMDVMLFLQV